MGLSVLEMMAIPAEPRGYYGFLRNTIPWAAWRSPFSFEWVPRVLPVQFDRDEFLKMAERMVTNRLEELGK